MLLCKYCKYSFSFHLDRFNREFADYVCSKVHLYNTCNRLVCYYVAHLHYYYYAGSDLVRDPLELRMQLAVNHIVEMGEKADSAEILNYLLTQIHCSTVAETCRDPTNEACGDSCPAHRSFRLELLEQSTCLCGESSEPKPWDFCSFVYPLHVDEILTQAKQKYLHWEDYIGKLQECYSGTQVTEKCCRIPQMCRRSERQYALLNAPEVLFLGITGEWDSFSLHCRKVMEISCIFPGILPITALFPKTKSTNYRLRSWIAFGLGHYVAYIRHSSQDLWFKYNDEKIVRMGEYFTCLRDEMDSNFHPVALFYEKIAETGETFSSYNEREKWETVERRVQEIEVRNGLAATIVPKPFNKGWNCEFCTCSNLMERNFCEACDKPRPKGISSPHSSTIPLSPVQTGHLSASMASMDIQSPRSAASGASPYSSYDQPGLIHSYSQGNSQPAQGYSPQLSKSSVPVSSVLRPVFSTCPDCKGRYPLGKICECKRFARMLGAKIVCPNCTLLNYTSNKVCGNCNAGLTFPVLSQQCVRCNERITGKAVCLRCGVAVLSSPCVYCSETLLACLGCAGADLAKSF